MIPTLYSVGMQDPINLKYHVQKCGAKRRGIEWQFTFESWVEWWEDNLGFNWVKERGKHRGQYQMARKGDKGPYSPQNAECLKVEDHLADRSKNGVEWRSGSPNGPVVGQLAKIENMLLAGHTVHATATKLGVSSTQIYRRYPQGVRSVMLKRGINRLTVTRYRRPHIIIL